MNIESQVKREGRENGVRSGKGWINEIKEGLGTMEGV